MGTTKPKTVREDIEDMARDPLLYPSLYPDKKRIDFEVGPCLISYTWENDTCWCSVIDIDTYESLKTHDLGKLPWSEWMEIFNGLEARFVEIEDDEWSEE
jgi:hypothetical protein